MIRVAKYIDNIRIGKLMEEMHQKSVYAEKARLDDNLFKKILIHSISQHGKTTCLFVSENKGEVDGFIVGCVDRVYGIAKEFYATDLFFYVAEDGSPKAAMGLLKAFMGWAEGADRVIEIRLGITGAIGGWERLQGVYERFGLVQDGVMMAKEVG